MEVTDLRRLIDWADIAKDNAEFWQRLWVASSAYDKRTEINIKALVVNHGKLPLDNPAESVV